MDLVRYMPPGKKTTVTTQEAFNNCLVEWVRYAMAHGATPVFSVKTLEANGEQQQWTYRCVISFDPEIAAREQ